MQPLPVISTPFSRLGSKYPDAIPLQRVDAKTVAEAMCEIFSRTGIPQHILTDQGSVFARKLTRELWHTPEAFVMRVVVADEESESLDTPGRVATGLYV